MAGEILLIILAFGLVFSGALGVILPFLPGVPVAWLGMLLFAYATDFTGITWRALFIFLALTIFTIIIDVAAPMIGAKKYQASRYGVIGSFLGILLGVLFLGPIGIIIGPFLGTFLGELWSGKFQEEAMRSAFGAVVGFLAGSAIKLSLILVMLGFLLLAIF